MAHTFTNLLTHIIFSTKDRMPTLEPDLKQRLFPYLGSIFRERKISLGMSVHFWKSFLSPLPGLGLICSRDPRLAPWATIYCHFVAAA